MIVYYLSLRMIQNHTFWNKLIHWIRWINQVNDRFKGSGPFSSYSKSTYAHKRKLKSFISSAKSFRVIDSDQIRLLMSLCHTYKSLYMNLPGWNGAVWKNISVMIVILNVKLEDCGDSWSNCPWKMAYFAICVHDKCFDSSSELKFFRH